MFDPDSQTKRPIRFAVSGQAMLRLAMPPWELAMSAHLINVSQTGVLVAFMRPVVHPERVALIATGDQILVEMISVTYQEDPVPDPLRLLAQPRSAILSRKQWSGLALELGFVFAEPLPFHLDLLLQPAAIVSQSESVSHRAQHRAPKNQHLHSAQSVRPRGYGESPTDIFGSRI